MVLDEGGWLGSWQVLNVRATLPHVLHEVEQGEARANLARVVGESPAPFRGMFFTDSDVYKVLEALAWSAATPGQEADVPAGQRPGDAMLERGQVLVDLVRRVQDPDGYLNSYVQGDPERDRWADPQWGHELYTAGHLFQAAVAASRVGVFPDLLDVAVRFADLLVKVHGDPDSQHIDGHPQVETALVELFRRTGRGEYLDLAAAQLDRRGHGWLGPDRYGSPYFQDHEPVRTVGAATGHAVRQLYLLTGMVDVAVERQDHGLLQAAERIWSDLYSTKTYISGAHGSRHRDEAIGDAYELPPDRAYAETCAAIASFQLNWRLLLATGRSRYADAMETALYNAVAVSTARSGTEFFYTNPLQLRTGHDGSQEDAPSRRLPWFSCACCPPNIARLIASINDYLVTTSDDALTVHHYAQGRFESPPLRLEITTGYPHSGSIRLRVEGDGRRTLRLRVPSWCERHELYIDGRIQSPPVLEGYLHITRDWASPTDIELRLDMPVRLVYPHGRVDALRGTAAVVRGPLLYALEQADLPDQLALEDVRLLAVGDVAGVRADPAVVAVEVTLAPAEPAAELYGENDEGAPEAPPFTTTMTPYYCWGNRAPGAMRVWLPLAPARSRA